tara:strand:- start:1726 stop:2004 length:279 start_codon:yes stop_codon:yes gene_type:complete
LQTQDTFISLLPNSATRDRKRVEEEVEEEGVAGDEGDKLDDVGDVVEKESCVLRSSSSCRSSAGGAIDSCAQSSSLQLTSAYAPRWTDVVEQ